MKLYTMFGSIGDEYHINKNKDVYTLDVNGICIYSTNDFKCLIKKLKDYHIVSIEVLAIHVKSTMGLEYKHCFYNYAKAMSYIGNNIKNKKWIKKGVSDYESKKGSTFKLKKEYTGFEFDIIEE